MIHTRTKPDTALRDALVAVEVAQAVHNHALLRSQTRKQPITLAKLKAFENFLRGTSWTVPISNTHHQ